VKFRVLEFGLWDVGCEVVEGDAGFLVRDGDGWKQVDELIRLLSE